MIRSVLLSSVAVRLAISVSVVVIIGIVMALSLYVSWSKAKADYKEWSSGDKVSICSDLVQKVNHQLRVLCPLSNDNVDEFLTCIARQRPEVLGLLEATRCPLKIGYAIEEIELSVPKDPGPLLSQSQNLPSVAVGLVALAVFLFGSTVVGRALLLESHVGWRRLTIVAAVVCSFAIPMVVYNVNELGPENLFPLSILSVVSLVLSAGVIIFFRRVAYWVIDGFVQGKEVQSSAARDFQDPTAGYLEGAPVIASEQLVSPEKIQLPLMSGNVDVKVVTGSGNKWQKLTYWLIGILIIVLAVSESSSSELLINFFFTWAVILTPPTVVRFIVVRRSIESREIAAAVSGALYFFNLMLFIALGSQNKSHAVLILGAIACYNILKHER